MAGRHKAPPTMMTSRKKHPPRGPTVTKGGESYIEVSIRLDAFLAKMAKLWATHQDVKLRMIYNEALTLYLEKHDVIKQLKAKGL